MSSPSSLLGLPPVSAELKTVLPYLQRAEELKKQDPVVAYWCAYHAAQVGISLKARDGQSRDLLLALLGKLEEMKAAIGPSDAVDIESVSSAYVENFALKVFANADNEDRNGRATRSTAKKFLAAATFLEVLKIFPKKDISDSTEEKIRYSKWKAADIAKAFREGRKPTPGPPGWAEEQEELKRLQYEQDSIPTAPRLPPKHSSESTLISASPPRITTKSASPPRISHLPPPSSTQPYTGWSDPAESWSTAATPGTDAPDIFAKGLSAPSGSAFDPSPTRSSRTKPRSGSVSSSNTISSTSGSARGSLKKPAWTNEELEGKYPSSSSPPKSALKSGSPDSDKRVRFSPPVIGTPPAVALSHSQTGSPTHYTGPESIYAPPPSQPISPPSVITPPHTIAGYPQVSIPPSHSTLPPRSYIYAPSPPAQTSPTRAAYPNVPPPPPPIPSAPAAEAFELTPTIIARAQKHCRFAISSLDYEDAEQARKELRAALAILGG